MQINEVTIFKLLLFTACIVLITMFVLKITVYGDSADTRNLCQTLMVKPEVVSSVVALECPQGYYENFGKFYDIKDDLKCCVQYEKRN